jgi:hypothetical protein
MTDSTSAELPLHIDRVNGSRPAAGEIRLVLSGHWHGDSDGASAEEPLLVVQLEGRRYRFPAERDLSSDDGPDSWCATFAIPDWAEPRQEGQAAVWLGRHVIPVPLLRSDRQAVPPPLGAAGPAPEVGRPVPASGPAASAPPAPAPSVAEAAHISRSGPLADILLRDTVAALHDELDRRAVETTRLRGALADTQSELEARVATQAQLEHTLSELNAELRRLMAAVEEQRQEVEAREQAGGQERAELERRLADVTAAQERQAAELAQATQQSYFELAELRRELAAAQVVRDAALSEAAGLRSELTRVGAELAVSRERASSESGDLAEASRLLADARALASRLRGEPVDGGD